MDKNDIIKGVNEVNKDLIKENSSDNKLNQDKEYYKSIYSLSFRITLVTNKNLIHTRISMLNIKIIKKKNILEKFVPSKKRYFRKNFDQ